jgi:nucleotide-binding universal stress UspA family protein
MFSNVIVGVDAGEGGRDAIALARLLSARDAKLTFVHVYQGDTRIWRASNTAYEAAERERAEKLLADAREQAGIQAELYVTGSPSVGRGLHEAAEQVGADLLTIGSSRRGLFGRVLLGDDTAAALSGAPCAVAIAPVGFARQPAVVREVGVGYDGSPESEHALAFARRLAGDLGAKLSAFEAVTLPPYAEVVAVGDVIEDLVADARKRVASLEGVEPHAAYGFAAEELALYSASLDLLVIGSRGYGPLGRLLHGSTARQLARSARCPLLVLTRATRAATPAGDAGGAPTTAATDADKAPAADAGKAPAADKTPAADADKAPAASA